YTLTQSGTSDVDTLVTVSTADGSAQEVAGADPLVNPDDYDGVSSHVVTILAGQTSATFTAAVNDDAVNESTENYTASINAVNNTNGNVTGSGTVTTTITDNDALTVSLATSSTVAEDVGSVTYTLTQSGTSDVDTLVTVSASDNTAIDPDDYTGGDTVVTIVAGSTSATFTAAIVDDAVVELTEDYTVSIDAVSNANGTVTEDGIQQVTTTIIDNDIEAFPSGLAYTVAGSKTVNGEQLYSVDLHHGDTVRVGEVLVDGVSLGPNSTSGMALNPIDGFLYAVAKKGGDSWLLKIDPTNAETVVIDDVNNFSKATAATFGIDGTYYLAFGNKIYEYNLSSNTLTLIAEGSPSTSADAIAINAAGDTMYLAVGDDLWEVEIDPNPAIEVPVFIGNISDLSTSYFIDGLSFDDNDVLWGLDNAGNILRIDVTDASAEQVATLAVNEVTGAGAHSLAISNVDPGAYVVLSDVTDLGDYSQDRSNSFTSYLAGAGSTISLTSDITLPDTSTLTIDPGSIDLSVDGLGAVTVTQSGGSDVENVYIQSDDDGNITVNDFVSADVKVRGHDESTVVINGAERGEIDTGEGDDSITINAATAVGPLVTNGSETFIINADGGDDTITLSDLVDSNYTINAGELQDGTFNADDIDTIVIDGSIDLGTGPLSLSNVEVLDITGTGNNALALTASDVLDASDDSNALIIKGDIGDVLTSTDGWTAGGTGVLGVDGGSYDAYTFDTGSGIATLLVDASVDTTGL
ncbi:MAG: Calx-beta domain-containing protein, partial [Cycloclasticus sp.]